MVSVTALAQATDGLLETALLGGDWRGPLAALTSASAARGATLVRHDPFDKLRSQRLDEFVMSTESIAEPVADYLAGTAPPDPRSRRVTPKMDFGFQTDFDQFSLEEINESPFYEEFLRDRDLRWHACALVDSSFSHGHLYLSLKRSARQDHYTPAEIILVNETLPTLRMAAAVSRAVFQSECRGMKSALAERAEALFEVDWRGRVIAFNEESETLIDSELNLHNNQLVAPLPEDQIQLDQAIAAPLASPPQVASVVLSTSSPDRKLIVRTMPVVGNARDIFIATAALIIVTMWEKPNVPPSDLVWTLRESFDLTGAEARVASLVGLGVTISEASSILDIRVGTARNYLKAAQSKIGVSRQAELASLVAQVRV